MPPQLDPSPPQVHAVHDHSSAFHLLNIQAYRIGLAMACAAILAGLLVLSGWALDLPLLKSVFSGGLTMKPNAAVGLIACGSALWLLAPPALSVARRRTGLALAAFLALLGAANLSQHLVGWDLHMDQLLFTEPPGQPGTLAPGRFGPLASIAFVFLGTSMLVLDASRPGWRAAGRGLALVTGVLMLVPLLGYAYGVRQLYGIAKLTAIAPHTSLALLMLSVGVLVVRPGEGPVRTICSDHAGGLMARRLLPALVLPFLMGWLVLRLQSAGFLEPPLALSVLIAAVIAVFSALIWGTADALSRIDARRQAGEEQVRALNATLERRVAERTAAAEELSEQLRALAHEVTLVEGRERRRIATVLHDDLAQTLAISNMRLTGLTTDSGNGEVALQDARSTIRQAIQHTRTLMRDLSPPLLHDVGFRAALDSVAETMLNQHGLNILIEEADAFPPLEEETRTFLFQATRELLTNVVKHGRVAEARVLLGCPEDSVRVEVIDAGGGIASQRLTWRPTESGGYGLFSIRERARAMGGSLEIVTSAGGGFRAVVRLPFKRELREPESVR